MTIGKRVEIFAFYEDDGEVEARINEFLRSRIMTVQAISSSSAVTTHQETGFKTVLTTVIILYESDIEQS